MLVLADQAGAQPLREVLAISLQQNPRVKAARTAARASEFEIAGAEAAKNPRTGIIADPAIGYTNDGNKLPSTGDLGLRSSILVYDGNRTNNEIERQKARRNNALGRVDATRTDLALRVADAYIEVIKQRRLEAIARTYVGELGELKGRIEEIVQIDRGRNYDLLQTLSRVQLANITLTQRSGSLQEAEATLIQTVGVPVEATDLPGEVDDLLPPTQQAAIDALAAHPQRSAAIADVDAARKQASIAQAWAYPRIDLQGTVNSRTLFGERKWLGVYDVRFVSQWNPFDGGVGKAGAQAAAEQVTAAQENVDAVTRDLSLEVTRHWTQIVTRRGRAAAQEVLVGQTQAVRDAYWEQFKVGRRSILDLLNAENEIFLARLNAEIERLELLQAKYRLIAAQARLLPTYGLANEAGDGRQ